MPMPTRAMVARSAASGSFNVSAVIASAPSRKLAATTGFASTVGEARDVDGPSAAAPCRT